MGRQTVCCAKGVAFSRSRGILGSEKKKPTGKGLPMQKFDHVRYFLIGKDTYESSLVLVYRKGHVISECEQYLMDILEDTIRQRYQMDAQ